MRRVTSGRFGLLTCFRICVAMLGYLPGVSGRAFLMGISFLDSWIFSAGAGISLTT